MGCQRSIAAQIVNTGAVYVLAVKQSQPLLLAHLCQSPDALARDPQAYREYMSEHREVEKGHGRIGTRWRIASNILRLRSQPALWPGMRSIAMEKSRSVMRRRHAHDHAKATVARPAIIPPPRPGTRIARVCRYRPDRVPRLVSRAAEPATAGWHS